MTHKNPNQVQIRVLMDTDNHNKESFYAREPNEDKFKKISKDKWFNLYDGKNVEVLAPLYVSNN